VFHHKIPASAGIFIFAENFQMQRLVYLLSYPFIWFISQLPFPLLYAFSDGVCFFVYHIIRYRRKTVRYNLNLVFPEKNASEIKNIERKAYKHMCDMFLEMGKSISISKGELKKRFVFTNIEEMKRLLGSGKSVIMLHGHYASYEWANALQFYGLDFKGFAIYKKLRNKYFDRLAHRIRGRFDAELIRTINATKRISTNERKGIRGIYAFIADQSPRIDRAWYWTKFMGVKAPAFTGGEVLAKRLDMAVVYLHVEKSKRGHYQATFKVLAENAKDCPDFEITEKFLRELEKQIREKPEHYLWTHKRWKHKDVEIPEDAVMSPGFGIR
jgi:KDO2-lipid IV(A) lauroyltransferase